jgi:hypothetical protein
MKILGLDASTTTIGYSVLNFDGYTPPKLEHYSYFKPPKDGHIAERLAAVRDFIYEIMDGYTPDEVIIEDILLGFKPGGGGFGGTTIKTLTSLAVLNRVVCLSVFDKLKRPPILQSVMKIRHAIKEDKVIPKKEEVPALMIKYLGPIDFPVQTKGKHKGELAPVAGDIADSIACVYGYCKLQLKEKEKAEKKNANAKRRKS